MPSKPLKRGLGSMGGSDIAGERGPEFWSEYEDVRVAASSGPGNRW